MHHSVVDHNFLQIVVDKVNSENIYCFKIITIKTYRLSKNDGLKDG